jgi:hypothetical protein
LRSAWSVWTVDCGSAPAFGLRWSDFRASALRATVGCGDLRWRPGGQARCAAVGYGALRL